MKRRKYNKKRTDLGRFKSPLEKEVYDTLVKVKNKKFNFQYEGELLKYFTVHNYKPDIVITYPGGKKLYVEIKGFLRYEDQVKMRAVKNANPDVDIHFCFTDRSRVGGSKMTPAQWCEKYGFPYTIWNGKVPKEWTKLSQNNQQQQPKSVPNAKKKRQSKPSAVTNTETMVAKDTVNPA